MLYVITTLVLLVYLVVVWLLGRYMPLHGPADVWILRGVLALLGIIGAAVAYFFVYKVNKAKEGSEDGSAAQSGGAEDIDGLVREAVRRLKHSTLGRGTNLGSLPLVFVLGDAGSTKTTVLIHSALDPELLAGQVYRDNEVLATSTANIWYTRQAIFVDPAGGMMAQADRWRRLVRLLQPGRFSAAIGKRAQAPRAAVVCFDCESFLQPGASESAVSAARRLSVRLQEVSQLLGISFPVYVLFTKVDRIAFFADFVRGMSKDEASEVLGTTLPLRSLSAGVYADEETRRLTKAFDEIFYSLAERRIVLLQRENEGDKLPGIYEFPRELRKLRTLLVQFLVDLARPSQLGTNPFLRGFYFTGVRPVVVDDVVAAPEVPVEAADPGYSGAGATQIFRGVGAQLQVAPVAVRTGGSRRVPQWVFLTSLFNEVLVKDRVALATSGSSSRVNLLRRIALGAAVLIALICLTGFAVSFFRNRALETSVQDAVADLSTVKAVTTQPASLDDLRKLDNLRSELADLTDYKENGAPLSLRWGLYEGDQIYPDARHVYFERFRQLLLAETQKRVIDNLQILSGKSATNASNESYQKSYDELKAYLIMTDGTNDHDYAKSTPNFLTPVLVSHWIADRDIEKERKDLATTQFNFYATELAKGNPYPTGNSSYLIGGVRAYLKQFTGIDRYYALLLASVSQKEQNFNEQFSDSNGIIASSQKVKGAFTRDGFASVQKYLADSGAYTGGDDWVLGPISKDMDQDILRQTLTDKYNQDFVNSWNAVLKNSSVLGYGSYVDADKKLSRLSGVTSPLLELLYFISHNTDPASPDIKKPFDPVATVEPPGPSDKLPDHYILPSNKDYIDALGNLQVTIHALAQGTGAPDPVELGKVNDAVTAAYQAVGKVIDVVKADHQYGNEKQVRALLEEPIKSVEALMSRAPGDVANGSAKGYCMAFAGVEHKYPFDPASLQDAKVDDLNSLFAPTGEAWKKLNDDVKQFVIKNGSRYEVNPQAKVKPTRAFLEFLNKVEALSETLYSSGSPPAHFSYMLKQMPSHLEGVVLKIGQVTLEGKDAQRQFEWTGAAEEVSVSPKSGEISYVTENGPWAVFRFVARANRLPSGTLEWVVENNGKPSTIPGGNVIASYDYQLRVVGNGGNPFSDFRGMKCVGQVTH
ncbi:MAG TPA: ImcF-related family protein [Candidatus Sulfotelmatobacter sp.]|jgi:type VI secretion system protein ImpL